MCKSSFESVKQWWDFFKSSLGDDIIYFARLCRKHLDHERVSLTNRLINLKSQLVQGDPLVSPEIIFVESQLTALSDRISQGVKVCSRAQWLEQGERPTRFFFKLERERAKRNCVTSILNRDGIVVSSRAEVEKAHVDFYRDLFSAENIDPLSQGLLF